MIVNCVAFLHEQFFHSYFCIGNKKTKDLQSQESVINIGKFLRGS